MPTPYPPYRLLVSDVDSTFIEQEVIELLARRAGREAEVADATRRAMEGELDFAASLRARVSVLEGLPQSVFAEVLEDITPMPGVPAALARLESAGVEVALVSGGFEEILAPLAERFGIRRFKANRLEVSGGILTGQVQGGVVDQEAKARWLRRWRGELGLRADQVAAVGDGANDIAMVREAGLGIAFHPKPALRAAADVVVDQGGFDSILNWMLPLEFNHET